MLLPLLAALLPTSSPAQLPPVRRTSPNANVGSAVLSPAARLTRAKLVFKGDAVNGLGGTRTRTWLQKNTDDLYLGGNDLLGYDGGIATFGEKGSFYFMFATVPKTRYLVTFVGAFRCTGISTMVADGKGASQGNASLSIDSGETVVMVPVKAVDTKMIATGFYPKGGEARCDIQRVEVTEIK